MLLCVAVLAEARAQESTRNIERPGEHTKHLTTDTVDRWLFDAGIDDVFRAEVASSEFDPVISLVQLDDAGKLSAVIVPDVDQRGSQSQLLARLERAGHFALLVHGPDNRGGGNYRLVVERFRSAPMEGEFADGSLDEHGLAHVRFTARAGETVVPRGFGVTEVLDPFGRTIGDWRGCRDITTSGEHHLRVRGSAGARFHVGVRRATERALDLAKDLDTEIDGDGIDQWIFSGRPGLFRALEVRGERVDVRVVPVVAGDEEPPSLDDRPEMIVLPTCSKGSIARFAFVLARDRPFRVQVRSLAPSPQPYRLSFGDPVEPLDPGAARIGRLAVCGSDFYATSVSPGQLLRVDVDSDAFDPILRVTTGDGRPMAQNDDGGTGLSCRHEWLVRSADDLRFQVACVGDGGGGDYRMSLREIPVPELHFGIPERGEIATGRAAYWRFTGATGRHLLVSARSRDADVGLTLFDQSGVEIARDEDSGADCDALFGIELASAGQYTLLVTARSGRGAYIVQAIDPEGGR